MVTYFILLILIGIIQIVILPITFLPDVALPLVMLASITAAAGFIGILDMVLPISTIFAIFTFYIGVEIGIFTYKIIKWIYSKIPGVN
jgi:hypothetical protein